ncbi:hypothetical protein K491DRAFT_685775 [Lophiostoma macrostomum CBS 122681]|uniref:Uncharacterized protein n=1 Tax=Lophiostoma macrostomum CBS 122681 TaxID=1314788 RepID=A0A6A6SL79_9PLEO|nr:hypothetical protein K491DRAFT_685775 [Lophiostoma macrostomum CBS 122681]
MHIRHAAERESRLYSYSASNMVRIMEEDDDNLSGSREEGFGSGLGANLPFTALQVALRFATNVDLHIIPTNYVCSEEDMPIGNVPLIERFRRHRCLRTSIRKCSWRPGKSIDERLVTHCYPSRRCNEPLAGIRRPGGSKDCTARLDGRHQKRSNNGTGLSCLARLPLMGMEWLGYPTGKAAQTDLQGTEPVEAGDPGQCTKDSGA